MRRASGRRESLALPSSVEGLICVAGHTEPLQREEWSETDEVSSLASSTTVGGSTFLTASPSMSTATGTSWIEGLSLIDGDGVPSRLSSSNRDTETNKNPSDSYAPQRFGGSIEPYGGRNRASGRCETERGEHASELTKSADRDHVRRKGGDDNSRAAQEAAKPCDDSNATESNDPDLSPAMQNRLRLRRLYQKGRAEKLWSLYNAAVTEAVRREREMYEVVVEFRVTYRTYFGQNILLVGDAHCLGRWHPERAIAMRWNEGHVWSVRLSIPKRLDKVEFKFLASDGASQCSWEYGRNHCLEVDPVSRGSKSESLHVIEDWWGCGEGG